MLNIKLVQLVFDILAHIFSCVLRIAKLDNLSFLVHAVLVTTIATNIRHHLHCGTEDYVYIVQLQKTLLKQNEMAKKHKLSLHIYMFITIFGCKTTKNQQTPMESQRHFARS